MPDRTFEARLRQPTMHLDGAVIIDLHGEINGSVDAALNAAFNQAEAQQPGTIILNFSEVDYINSTGIALVVRLLAERDARAGTRGWPGRQRHGGADQLFGLRQRRRLPPALLRRGHGQQLPEHFLQQSVLHNGSADDGQRLQRRGDHRRGARLRGMQDYSMPRRRRSYHRRRRDRQCQRHGRTPAAFRAGSRRGGTTRRPAARRACGS